MATSDYPDSLNTWRFWCQKVLPLVYDNSISYYEVLCKVVEMVQDVITNQTDLSEEVKQLGLTVEEIQKETAYLASELEKIKNGEYMSLYIEALQKWIDQNFEAIVQRMVKYIFFGLDDTGHFVAYIPNSWKFLQFDTDIDPDSKNYGHLILTW